MMTMVMLMMWGRRKSRGSPWKLLVLSGPLASFGNSLRVTFAIPPILLMSTMHIRWMEVKEAGREGVGSYVMMDNGGRDRKIVDSEKDW